MHQENQAIYSSRIPKIRYWKAGITAILVILGFSFINPSSKTSITPPVELAAGPEKTEGTPPKLTAPSEFPHIKIKNFGQMDDYFYRGAQPKPDDYKALADLGIKTIIDLRDDPTSYEKTRAEASGIQYVNIPMSDKDRPDDSKIVEFFNIANDQSRCPFYVHCAGGRHRTGLIGAVYRFDKYGWNYDQAYQEMKNYDYYSRWGHEAIKDYVRDYYEKIKFAKPILSAVKAADEAPATQPITSPPPPKPKE